MWIVVLQVSLESILSHFSQSAYHNFTEGPKMNSHKNIELPKSIYEFIHNQNLPRTILLNLQI